MFQFFSKKDNSKLHLSQTKPPPRLLCLQGQTGTLACRVHDPLAANLFPQHSKS